MNDIGRDFSLNRAYCIKHILDFKPFKIEASAPEKRIPISINPLNNV